MFRDKALLPTASTPRLLRRSKSAGAGAKKDACEGASAKHEQFGSSNLPVPTIFSAISLQ